MTDLKRVSDSFYLSEQISREDIKAAEALGVKRIICNRPDDEDAGQPSAETVAAWAEEAGMGFSHFPMDSSGPSAPLIEATIQAVLSGEKILAYCRTGTRSSILWSLANAKLNTMPTEEILAAGEGAGYNLSHLAQVLEQVRSN